MAARLTILSGGQTGADRAALDAALEAGVPCGGWCTKGRRAEDGRIDDRYPLREMPTASYKARTRQNVIDSDGTVLFSALPLTGGTKLTASFCRRENRPCLVVDAHATAPEDAADQVRRFVVAHAIQRLNVAGPRASSDPAIDAWVRGVVGLVLGA